METAELNTNYNTFVSTLMKKILEYLLIILIILDYPVVYSYFEPFSRFVTYSVLLILLILVVSQYKYITSTTYLFILIYYLGALLPFSTISKQDIVIFIQRYVFFLPLFFVYLRQNRKKNIEYSKYFLNKYINVVSIIAIISLFMWVLGPISGILSPTNYYPHMWKGYLEFIPSYYNIYFETGDGYIIGNYIARNTAIFNEGPMYNMILCSALVSELYLKKKSTIKVYILIITILTTSTTTGFFVLLIIGIYKFFYQKRRISLLTKTLYFIISIIIISTGSIFLLNNKSKNETGSLNTRTNTILVDIEVGMNNPILGSNFIKGEFKGKNSAQIEQSNSLFYLFACGGLYGVALYAIPLLYTPYIYYRKYKDSSWLFTMAVIFLVFTFTLSLHKYIILMFVAWGISNFDIKRMSINSKQISIS